MKKKVFALLLCGLPLMINAQDAFDVLQMSQTELRGTSRFQSMAGAFGALGGDLSVLTQNPGGIGVYRNSDLGVTFSLDFNSTTAGVDKLNETKFNLNNVGYIGAIRLDSDVLPNLNFGFTYNRLKSYNRHYVGGVGDIPTSMSNYVADAFVNNSGYTSADLYMTETFDPYFDGYAPWAAVTMFDMPTKHKEGEPNGYVGIINDYNGMMGMFERGFTTGNAYYEVDERGHADEYNIAFGGNLNNKFYWGLDFGILDLDYRSYQAYVEELDNPWIMADDEDLFYSDLTNVNTHADWGLYNYLHTEGTGVNFKLGFIWRPTQELRIGAAFHTPTYYDMRDTYYVNAVMDAYQNNNLLYSASKGSNDGYDYSSTYTISTPWRFMGSVAGVIGTKGIISLDYECVTNNTMRVGDDRGNNYPDVTDRIKGYTDVPRGKKVEAYFKPTHIIRIGGEYRINPNWSLRAGYSYKSSQVTDVIDKYGCNVVTVGTNPSYQYDKDVHYITGGLGYRYKAFYGDVAYVHQIRNSVYNAFSPIDDADLHVGADVKDNNNRLSLTLGMRF